MTLFTNLYDRSLAMANCVECGTKLGFLDAGVGGLCSQCNYLSSVTPNEVEALTQTVERNEAMIMLS